MTNTTELSRQQRKSKETRERIFHAAKQILLRDGYEQLSIKNICEEAGVSNGSFYHHFKTKDDLLSYYIEDQPSVDPQLLKLPANAEDAKNAITHAYMNYATHCRELGIEFITGYYTPKNQALNPAFRTERPYLILSVQAYLEKATAAGILSLSLPLEEIITDIRMIVIGNVFEWCMMNGNIDFENNIKRTLYHYLDSVL